MQLSAFLAAAFCAASARAYDFGYFPSQLGQLQAYQTSRFLECRAFVGTCAPTKASCASAVCRQCTSIVGNFPAALNSCCKQARPTDCFIGLANGGGAAATTATGPLTDAAAPTTGGGATMTMTTPPPTTGPDSMTMSPDSMTASPASMTTSPASIASSGSTATPGPSTTSSRAGAAGRDLRAEMAVAGMAGLGLLAWAL